MIQIIEDLVDAHICRKTVDPYPSLYREALFKPWRSGDEVFLPKYVTFHVTRYRRTAAARNRFLPGRPKGRNVVFRLAPL